MKRERIQVIDATTLEAGLREIADRHIREAGYAACPEKLALLDRAVQVAVEIAHFFMDAREADADADDVLPSDAELFELTRETDHDVLAGARSIWNTFVDEAIDGRSGASVTSRRNGSN